MSPYLSLWVEDRQGNIVDLVKIDVTAFAIVAGV
jgi:hypothetical protein